jgi:hypothetical protein
MCERGEKAHVAVALDDAMAARVEKEKEKAEEMVMLAPRSNVYGRRYGCSRHAVHDVLGVHRCVATTSSGRHHHGSLNACLHG